MITFDHYFRNGFLFIKIFGKEVIRRTGYSEFARTFKGVVVAVIGNTADVETVSGVRSLPLANLSVMCNVPDSRTQRFSIKK